MLALCAGALHAAEFEPERLKDGVALPAGMAPLYLSDFSISHLMDGRIYVLDAKTGKYAGAIDSGYSGQFTLSPDGRQAYTAATYMSRHTHGERSDILEIHDTATLRMTGDVVLPTKHAQALYTRELMRTSFDGRYVFVQNATPAVSVTVVDVAQRKVLAEISTPGCWALYPSMTASLRFSVLCGDGTLNTLTLNDDGSVASRAASAKFFDSDKDPVYISAASDADSYYFLSFHGHLTRAALSGAAPALDPAVSLVKGRDLARNWRPGGYQLQALDRASGVLYVGMHPDGKEGSHKYPAREIWAVDPKTGAVLARHKASNAIALSIGAAAAGDGASGASKDASKAAAGTDQPTLYALDGTTNRVHAYRLGARLRELYVSAPVGEVPVQVDAP